MNAARSNRSSNTGGSARATFSAHRATDEPPPLLPRSDAEPPSSKRARESPPGERDIYIIAKDLQNRTGDSLAAEATEDRRFREYFGVSALVALSAWQLLQDFIPEDAMLVHLLWALYFMKVYPKEGTACATAGGSGGAIDPKTLRKYVWPIILGLADLEPFVVSENLIRFQFDPSAHSFLDPSREQVQRRQLKRLPVEC